MAKMQDWSVWPHTDRNVYNIEFDWDITRKWHLDGLVQHVRRTLVRQINGDSSELNNVYGPIVSGTTGGAIPAETVEVALANEGILWGYGINLRDTLQGTGKTL